MREIAPERLIIFNKLEHLEERLFGLRKGFMSSC